SSSSNPSHHHRALHSFPTRRSSDLSLNQRPVWRESHFLLSAHNRASGQVRTLFDRVRRCAPGAKVSGARFSIAPPLHLRVDADRSEEHTSELQSRVDLVCRLLLEKK